jgi:hypothetical protein
MMVYFVCRLRFHRRGTVLNIRSSTAAPVYGKLVTTTSEAKAIIATFRVLRRRMCSAMQSN